MSKTRFPTREPARARSVLAQRGFTLVELMISMVIGLFIVLALLTLLINVNRNNNEMTKTNRVIENGRYALQLLESDVQHAGFWGGYVPSFDDLTNYQIPGDVPTAVPDPCLATGSWDDAYKINVVGLPIQAYEIPYPVPSPTLSVCASKVVSPQARTDVLVVRHVENCKAGSDTGCAAPSGNNIYMQRPTCDVSNLPGGLADPLYPHFTTQTFALGTVTSLTPMYKRGCTAAADQYKYLQNLYYVRNYAVTPGDGVPTLMRSDFANGVQSAAQAMIEGVEGFRVELGIDTVSDSNAPVTFTAIAWADPKNLVSPTNRGDGIPDSYVHCTTASPCTPYQLMNTVAAKIYVLVRSEAQTSGYVDNKTYNLGSTTLGPFGDHYKRHLFTQTVRLTNISSRRETPP